jgi:hypothetical protein
MRLLRLLTGVVVTLSGVCFWVGVWDVLDYAVLPRGWQWRVRTHAHALFPVVFPLARS